MTPSRLASPAVVPAAWRELLRGMPRWLIDDRLMLPGVRFGAVADVAHVERVAENGPHAGLRPLRARRSSDAVPVQPSRRRHLRRAADRLPVDSRPDDLSLGRDENQPVIGPAITVRSRSSQRSATIANATT